MSKQKTAGPKTAKLPLLPCILAFGYVPLLMRLYTYDPHLGGLDWFQAEGNAIDLFLHIKMVALMILGILCLVILVWKRVFDSEKLYFAKGFWLLIICGILVLVSGIASAYRYFAFHGTLEMFQPVQILLCYFLLCYYTFCAVRNGKQLKRLFLFSLPGLVIEFLIGFFQGAHLDFLMTHFAKYLYLPKDYWEKMDTFRQAFVPGTAYGTLYNQDYLSVWCAILFPVLCGVVFSVRKKWLKLLLVIIGAMTMFTLAQSAVSGYFGLFAAGLFVLLVWCFGTGEVTKRKKLMLCGTAAVIAAAVIAVFAVPSLKDLALETTGLNEDPVESMVRPERIKTGEDGISFTLTDGETFVVQKEGENRTFPAGDSEIKVKEEELEGGTKIGVTVNGYTWQFFLYDGTYYYINNANKLLPLDHEDEMENVFPNLFFNRRGLIWNETLHLLPKHLLLGCGSNAFLLEFPQDNILIEAYHEDRRQSLDVKPHSFYMQQWIENGLPEMILLVIFFLWIIVRGVKVWVVSGKSDSGKTGSKEMVRPLLIGCTAAMVSWLVVMLVNDLEICAGPVFFVIAGMTAGLACGYDPGKPAAS